MNDERGFMSQEQAISVSRRLIPALLSLVLFMFFIAFMIGYFLGVKYTTDEFVTQIRQETLADQLLVSAVGSSNMNNPSEQEQTASAPVQETMAAPREVVAHTEAVSAEAVTSVTPPSVPEVAQAMGRYSAELIGFGTKAAATDFIKRVSAYNPISLELKERQSKTPRGRVIKWYQVVTGKYQQKQELQKELDTLIKKERLQDIKIVAFAPSAKDNA